MHAQNRGLFYETINFSSIALHICNHRGSGDANTWWELIAGAKWFVGVATLFHCDDPEENHGLVNALDCLLCSCCKLPPSALSRRKGISSRLLYNSVQIID